jgi:hypothetical protein
MTTAPLVAILGHMMPSTAQMQCCQLTEISAPKLKSGRIKISAAAKICGRRFVKKGRKMAELF